MDAPNTSSDLGGFDFSMLNPALPEVRANPYPIYQMLRNAMPVCPTPVGAWLISRYADGSMISTDRRFVTIDLKRIGAAA